jgi:hypothetical protein
MFLFVTLCSILVLSIVYKHQQRKQDAEIYFKFFHNNIFLFQMGVIIIPRLYFVDHDIIKDRFAKVLNELLSVTKKLPKKIEPVDSKESLETVDLEKIDKEISNLVDDVHEMYIHHHHNRNRSYTYPRTAGTKLFSDTDSDTSEEYHQEYVFIDDSDDNESRDTYRRRLFSV